MVVHGNNMAYINNNMLYMNKTHRNATPAVGKLQQALADTTIESTQIAVYSNVDAQPHRDAGDFKGLLARQVVNPVLWEASLRAMLAQGVELFYEVGSGRVLSGTLKRIDRKAACECFGD